MQVSETLDEARALCSLREALFTRGCEVILAVRCGVGSWEYEEPSVDGDAKCGW